MNGTLPAWLGRGDLNAFFVLMLDNMTQLVIFGALLTGVFGFPADIVFRYMVPGTALGILVGNAMFTWLAIRLTARNPGSHPTAMPLGIDTVSLFGYTFGIIGPVWLATGDATFTWHVASAVIVLSGMIKVLLSFGSRWIKEFFPRAALLGSIAAIALMLIAFLPSLTIFRSPVVGFIALGLVFMNLFTRHKTIRGVPGVFLSVCIATALFYALRTLVPGLVTIQTVGFAFHGLSLPTPLFSSPEVYSTALSYISIVLPLSIVNVVGGIDVTESAAAAGDKYDTRKIIFTEGVTTVLVGLFGGALQTTPYIGHPAYKKMGARSGYTLATGLFMGLGGMLGVLGLAAGIIPQQAVVPILIFIGLELSYQAFRTVPAEHSHAVAICFLPAIAALVLIMLGQLGVDPRALVGEAKATFASLTYLANGFVVTAMVWGAALASLIDERYGRVAAFLAMASVFSLFGLMHSPLEHAALFLPWQVGTTVPAQIASAYGLLAVMAFLSHVLGGGKTSTANPA